MATGTCPNCGNVMSTDVESCPHCGSTEFTRVLQREFLGTQQCGDCHGSGVRTDSGHVKPGNWVSCEGRCYSCDGLGYQERWRSRVQDLRTGQIEYGPAEVLPPRYSE